MGPDDLFSLYLEDIGAWPLLSHHQEFKLGVVITATQYLFRTPDTMDIADVDPDRFFRTLIEQLVDVSSSYLQLAGDFGQDPYLLAEIIGEAILMCEAYLDDSPSAFWTWLDQLPRGKDSQWPEVAGAAVELLRLFFVLPFETQALLEQIAHSEHDMPGISQLQALLPYPEMLHLDLLEMQDKFHVARDALITANLRLVISLAKRYRNSEIPFSDRVSEGNIGLIRAAEKFDPARGTRFSTYATHWIRQALSRSTFNSSRTIRLPVHVIEKVTRMKRIMAEYEQLHGRPPRPEEVLFEMGMIPDSLQKEIIAHQEEGQTLSQPAKRTLRQLTRKIDRLLIQSMEIESLDEVLDPEIGATQGDLYVDTDQEQVEALVEGSLIREKVHRALGHLNPKQRRVLELRFGLLDGQPRTLEEIGAALNVTRERIRQIEAKALRLLRHPQVSWNLMLFRS